MSIDTTKTKYGKYKILQTLPKRYVYKWDFVGAQGESATLGPPKEANLEHHALVLLVRSTGTCSEQLFPTTPSVLVSPRMQFSHAFLATCLC